MNALSAEENLLETVAVLLRQGGVNAGWQDTGGGTYCVVIADADGDVDEPRFWFGTADESWAGQVDGSPSALWTDVPSSENSPERIAEGILAALARFFGHKS